MRLSENLRSDLVPTNGRSMGDADSAGEGRRGRRTATSAANASERTGGQTADGEADNAASAR